jgi:hypothetical protein
MKAKPNEPSRLQPLHDALRELGYHPANNFTLVTSYKARDNPKIEAWVGNGPVLLVQAFGPGGSAGWDIFAPVTDNGDIETTIAAVRERVLSVRQDGGGQ